MHDHLYAVIMAGGVGSRLWPRSREGTPKQFLDLVGSQTLLQQTVERIEPLVPRSRLVVVAGQHHVHTVLEQVPDLPPENVLAEPARRHTAPGVGLAAAVLHRRDPEAVMATLWADHYIADVPTFRRAISAGSRVAQAGYLVTLGVVPTWPNTGYGYIQRGEALDIESADGLPAYQVRRFAEKPDAPTAQQFCDSGEYYWNAGIFVWRVDAILAEIARLMPQLDAELGPIAAAWDTPQRASVLADGWSRVPKTSIDLGVMERAARVAVVPVDMGWDDIGTWATLSALRAHDKHGNGANGPGRHVLLNTRGTYIYTTAGRLVAAVGLEDLVIVDTPDAVLICHKSEAQAVKDLVEQLQAEGLNSVL